MDKPQSELDFKIMALWYKVRDFFMPRGKILEELEIKPGSYILDYGCGPGSYSVAAAKLIGDAGKVYALDIHPLAIKMAQKAAAKKGLANIVAIQSDCATGLPDKSIDVALLCDILHDLREPDKVLSELHRVLKPGGILSSNDHHLHENEIIAKITGGNLFRLSQKGKKVCNFIKQECQ